MKRTLLAIALLLSTLALCLATHFYQKAQTKALFSSIDKMEQSFDSEDPLSLLGPSQDLIREFRHRTRLFPLFLRHNTLAEAEAELLTLPALLQEGEPKDIPATLVRLRSKMTALYETELPFLENIL